MSRVIQSLIVCLLLLSLAACSQKPVFAVEVLKTLTPLAPTLAPSLTAPSPTEIPTLTPTPVAQAMPSGFSPILYGLKYDANTFFILLGGVQGNTWLAPEQAAAQFANLSASAYDVYPFTQDPFQVQGYSPQFSPSYKIYTVGTDVSVAEFGMVGVAQGWPILQRNMQELSPDNELYRQAVRDWLTAEEVPAPELGTLRIFRVDIEGDGVDEIFISATHLDGSQHTTKMGDYSVILMRKVQGNSAVMIPVVGDIYRSLESEITFPQTYSIGNFMDLNQDGALDVIVDIQRWEGDGARLFQINGQDIIQVP